MPNFSEWEAANARDRIRLASAFVRDNPHIVAFYFDRRFELFKKHVVRPKFNVVDWWDRYEWQGRGSTHSHGLYYCAQAPHPDEELGYCATPFSIARLASYWGCHISAVHPEPKPREIIDEGSVLSLPLRSMTFTFKELSDVLTRCYLHRCWAGYCLKVNKQTKEETCRFDAPWEVRSEPTFAQPEGKPYKRFLAQRNHMRLNAYSRTLALGWRANTDIQVCTSTAGVVNYMGVYASKGETQSLTFKEMAAQVLPHIKPGNPMLSFVTKLINKSLGSRDYSAQEVMHQLFHLPLTHCSRSVIMVDCRPIELQPIPFYFRGRTRSDAHDSVEDGEEEETINKGRTIMLKYLERDVSAEDVSYLDFLLHFDHVAKKTKRRPRAKARVLNFFPRYKSAVDMENFARVKLTLHHPFRVPSDLYIVAGATYSTFTEAYDRCRASCNHDLVDAYGEPDLEGEEDDPDWEDVMVDETLSFDELGLRRPGGDGEEVDLDALGERPLDRAKDWLDPSHIDPYDLDPMTYWANMKAQHPISTAAASNTDANTLQSNQRVLYDLITNHFTAFLQERNPPQLLVNLDGVGGTGKTYVVEVISSALVLLASGYGRQNPLMRCAPTGVAAFLISGRTINSIFRIPIVQKYGTLPLLEGAGLAQLQAQLRGVKYIVIDEKSMVGLTMLSWIHARCAQAFPGSDEDFGGISIILSGDFGQLPPVGRRPLFDRTKQKCHVETHGQHLYNQFNKTIVLDVIMRQQGDSQAQFRDALGRLRDGESTANDWNLLSKRCRVSLPVDERDSFESAVCLCAKRAEVSTINHQKMRDCGSPVIVAQARHDKPGAAKVDARDGGNLHSLLPLCIGGRVMLLHNIWTEVGLVNGTTGEVDNVLWDPSVVDPRKEAPKAVLVALSDYHGPALYVRPDGKLVIPVFPISREFYFQGSVVSRVQFPICSAWAITIHKSQGLSLEKVVVSVSGDRDHAPGLMYVAVSRVKSLEGLMFNEPFSLHRLRGGNAETVKKRNLDITRRLRQLVTSAECSF